MMSKTGLFFFQGMKDYFFLSYYEVKVHSGFANGYRIYSSKRRGVY